MFFSSWSGLGRVAIVGLLTYAALLLWLRLSGKRTMSKWNAFDAVVTIALGSTFATALLSKGTSLVEGVLALGLLVFLQFAITWLSVRSQAMRRLIKAEPTLLLKRGRFLYRALKSQRVTESEVRAAVRAEGIAALEDVYAVVLETDGTFSVIKHQEENSDSALSDVINSEEDII